ncbi:endolytic transglycosylase MltG [Gordonia sp. (in: high G+C Gram-positive bacteria)]|uniref:endolytic transglycosylase MltG n=1 Tax=Gordonia sp. (in: high G+C Gram-positive bacteria) TaxID=84139 RepID=UPI003C75FBF5
MSDRDDPRRSGGGPSESDRRRYFTESMGDGQPGHRHRRRRAPGDPTTTGSIPIVRVGDSLPDPTIEYRTPEPPAGEPSPYFQVQYRPTEVEGVSFTAPRTSPQAAEPPTVINPPVPEPAPRSEPTPPPAPTGLFDILDAGPDDYAAPDYAAPDYTAPDYTAPGRPEPAYEYRRETEVPLAAEPVRAQPVEIPAGPGWADFAPETSAPETYAPETLASGAPVSSAPVSGAVDSGPFDGDDDEVVERAMPARRRNRKVLLSILVIAIVIVLVLSGLALKALGVFDSNTDYSSTTGHGVVLVEIPADSSIRGIGDTLAAAGVVGSRNAFVDATGNDTVSAGFYKLPKGLSAQSAVAHMQDPANRAGFMVLPDGLQLDTKQGIDGKSTPGIFEKIAAATTVKTDDGDYGVTVPQLVKAAESASATDLGIPSWARAAFDQLGRDHRRIEGLIAAGAWEDLDPRLNAVQLLHRLISDSANRFTAWGLESANETGLDPYQTLTTASIVEREARKEEDFPKVARVILNRLKVDQRLEMDSTANYTARITNIDVFGEAYKDENAWNTYQHKGLPITPIGAVGERALHATLNPADGNWLYFVTVDKEGTTLFSRTYDQQKKNREVACKNKLLTTGCE